MVDLFNERNLFTLHKNNQSLYSYLDLNHLLYINSLYGEIQSDVNSNVPITRGFIRDFKDDNDNITGSKYQSISNLLNYIRIRSFCDVELDIYVLKKIHKNPKLASTHSSWKSYTYNKMMPFLTNNTLECIHNNLENILRDKFELRDIIASLTSAGIYLKKLQIDFINSSCNSSYSGEYLYKLTDLRISQLSTILGSHLTLNIINLQKVFQDLKIPFIEKNSIKTLLERTFSIWKDLNLPIICFAYENLILCNNDFGLTKNQILNIESQINLDILPFLFEKKFGNFSQINYASKSLASKKKNVRTNESFNNSDKFTKYVEKIIIDHFEKKTKALIPISQFKSKHLTISSLMKNLFIIKPTKFHDNFLYLSDNSIHQFTVIYPKSLDPLIQALPTNLFKMFFNEFETVKSFFKIEYSNYICPFGIITGPSGSGKTYIAQNIFQYCGINYIVINCSEILRRHEGDSEKIIRNIFCFASRISPCGLIFENSELICCDAIVNQGINNSITKQLFIEFLRNLDIFRLNSLIINESSLKNYSKNGIYSSVFVFFVIDDRYYNIRSELKSSHRIGIHINMPSEITFTNKSLLNFLINRISLSKLSLCKRYQYDSDFLNILFKKLSYDISFSSNIAILFNIANSISFKTISRLVLKKKKKKRIKKKNDSLKYNNNNSTDDNFYLNFNKINDIWLTCESQSICLCDIKKTISEILPSHPILSFI